MQIFQIIIEIFLQLILEGVLEGMVKQLIKLNNWILKRRGIETRSWAEIKVDLLKKRYLEKNVFLKEDFQSFKKNDRAVIVAIENELLVAQFEDVQATILEIPRKYIALCSDKNHH